MKLFHIKQFHRLNTLEDSKYLHIHKFLGLAVLGNFGYRLYLLHMYGSMMFTPTLSTLAWILLHSSLHITSFQFHLPNNRNKKYNIIWPEMRWHTMIFAYRSLAAMFVVWLCESSILPTYVNKYSRIPIVVLTFLSADYVTYYYKKKGGDLGTTMRGNPYPDFVPEYYRKIHNVFYSMSQVLATLNVLSSTDMESIFLLLIPIQTAPFCMTLVKKGIIDQTGWHIYYTSALLLNYIYTSRCIYIPSHMYWVSFGVFTIFRFKYHVNKYVLWGVLLSTFSFYL
jgi:hypothetical protein